MPMRHCATCLGWNSSIQRRSPSSANRWVARPRFTPLLATSRAQYFTERFRAAIAYYPNCGVANGSDMTTPVLVLIGEADEWNSAERCREVAAHRRPGSAPIALSVYPGVHHAFDVAQLSPGIRAWGGWVEYNEPAAKDAEKKTRAFLDAHLTKTSSGEPMGK